MDAYAHGLRVAMNRLLASLLLLCCGSVAAADVVTLRDGRVLRGGVQEERSELVIAGRYGSVRVKKAKVLSWVRDAAPGLVTPLAKRIAGLDAEGRYLLGVSLRGQARGSDAKKAFEAAILLDRDHPGARGALGYVQHMGRWINRDDLARLKGLVRHRGRWISLEEKAAELKKDSDRRRERARTKRERKAALVTKRMQKDSGEPRRGRLTLGLQSYPSQPYRAGRSVVQRLYGPGVFNPYCGNYLNGPVPFPLAGGRSPSNQDILTLIGARCAGIPIPSNLRRPFYGPVTGTRLRHSGYGLQNGYGGYGHRQGYGGGYGHRQGYGVTVQGRSVSQGGRLRVGYGVRARQSGTRSGYGVGLSGSYRSGNGRTRVQFRSTP